MTIFHLEPSAQNVFYFRQVRSVAQSCRTLYASVDCPTRFLCLWNSSGKKTGVGCRFLLQGIFLTQGSTSVSCVSCIGRQAVFTTAPPGKPPRACVPKQKEASATRSLHISVGEMSPLAANRESPCAAMRTQYSQKEK